MVHINLTYHRPWETQSEGGKRVAEPARSKGPKKGPYDSKIFFGNSISLILKSFKMNYMVAPDSQMSRRRGRPITAPGPIGEVARAMGGMQRLASLLGCSRRALLKAATKDRWLEGDVGVRLVAFCRQHGIKEPGRPPIPPREVGRLTRRGRARMGLPQINARRPEPSEPGTTRRGRPISVPGPIGAVAKSLGGMNVLADLLNYSLRALQVAARQGRWIRDPEGVRLEALCRQNGIPYSRTQVL